jgi:membrane protease subunit HflC
MKNWVCRLIAIGLLAVLAAGAALSIFVVDETEFAVLTSFGRIVGVFGERPGETGLHFKAPWQVALNVDRRVKVFEPPSREVITGDKRNIEVGAFVVWQVADPVVFLRAAGQPELAEARLNERIAAAISDAVGRRDLAALASTDTDRFALNELTREVTSSVQESARGELGAQVIDVRLRRFNHPLEVRPAIFDLIRSERRQVAARLRAEGEAQYLAITSQADRARDEILAKAEAEALRLRGNAEAEATRILNEAHGRDPKFFEFLRTLESYRSILDGQTTVVLSSSSPLLKLLVDGPASTESPGSPNQAPPVGAGSARRPDRSAERAESPVQSSQMKKAAR